MLVVDDVPSMAEMVSDALGDRGFDAQAARGGEHAVRLLGEERFDALLTDLRMPGIDGLELMKIARARDPELVVLVMTAYGAIDSAIDSIRRGAYHYFTKPFKTDELVLFLGRALEERKIRHEAALLRHAFDASAEGAVGTSAAMREVFEMTARVANADVPVLVLGETGTGKGVVARALHAKSGRSHGTFVTVNCAALPENLLESELFGHVRGAFTGASRDRAGLHAEAAGGTLFLDEIGEMSVALQAKLLDVLERRRMRAVGDTKEREVDVRIVAATHRDLNARVASGHFREDLRYRLDVVTIEVPPLRQRKDDIPLLASHFLAESARKHPDSVARQLDADATAALVEYRWPGNVRELAHLIERLVLLVRRPVITRQDLPAAIVTPATREPIALTERVMPIREVQRRYARWALEQLGGARMRVAEALGIDKKTLAKWLADEPVDS
ncbi:MAG TPA: sigma-54 dependent transcriptional regulator [Minicystis sp.]|nr:sigma-54 dependent transcriptional regulator [Minicystis sp.]